MSVSLLPLLLLLLPPRNPTTTREKEKRESVGPGVNRPLRIERIEDSIIPGSEKGNLFFCILKGKTGHLKVFFGGLFLSDLWGDASKSGQGEMGGGRRVSPYELSGLFPFLARVHSSTIY